MGHRFAALRLLLFCGLLALLITSSVVVLIEIGASTVELVFGVTIVSLTAGLVLISYLRAAFTKMQSCSRLWQLVLLRARQETEVAYLLHERVIQLNDCIECEEPLPYRSHHCDDCDTCTFRYELHSRLIGRCVGLETFKFYFLTHLYALFMGLAVVIIHGARLDTASMFKSPATLLLFSFAFFFALCQLLLAIRSVAFHSWLIARGQTMHDWRQHCPRNEFDRGWAKNLQSVFGDSHWLSYVVPIAPRWRNGLDPRWYVSKERTQRGQVLDDSFAQDTPQKKPSNVNDSSGPEDSPVHFIQASQQFSKDQGVFFDYRTSDDERI